MSIDWQTLRLAQALNELAALTANGFKDFAEATEEDQGAFVLVDRSAEDENGAPIVLDAVIIDPPECPHHDIISHYDDLFSDVIFRVEYDDGPYDFDGPSIVVMSLSSDNEIRIVNGRWYFV